MTARTANKRFCASPGGRINPSYISSSTVCKSEHRNGLHKAANVMGKHGGTLLIRRRLDPNFYQSPLAPPPPKSPPPKSVLDELLSDDDEPKSNDGVLKMDELPS